MVWVDAKSLLPQVSLSLTLLHTGNGKTPRTKIQAPRKGTQVTKLLAPNFGKELLGKL